MDEAKIRIRTVDTPIVISGYGNGLYNIYGNPNTSYLKPNMNYTIYFKLPTMSYQYHFTTIYSPAFTTPDLVRSGLGDTIADLSDDMIWKLIRTNSQYILTHLREDYDGTGTEAEPDFNMQNWTRIKTQIDCLYAMYTGIAMNYGSEKKKLGFLDISKDTRLPYIDDLLGNLKDALLAPGAALFGFYTGSAVKGENPFPYPLNPRVNF